MQPIPNVFFCNCLINEAGIKEALQSVEDRVSSADGSLKAFEQRAAIKLVEKTATTSGNEDEVKRIIAQRRAAIAARRAERLNKSIEKRQGDYQERGAR